LGGVAVRYRQAASLPWMVKRLQLFTSSSRQQVEELQAQLMTVKQHRMN